MTLTAGNLVLANPLTCTNTPKGENKLYSDAKGVVPSLDLRFAEGKNLNDYMTGQNLITFSRSSIGTYVDENGIIQLSSADQPRFDHDPTTGDSLGLLVEESRTNYLLQSEDFSTTWATARASISSDVAIAPNGSTTADKLAEDATASSTHVTIQSGQSFTSGVIYTFSCYAKAGERQSIRLSFPSAAFTTNIYGHFNLSAGTVTTASAEVAASIQALGDSWYRCIVSATATTTATGNATIFLGEDAATASFSFDGDGTSGIYIWGAQLEEGSFPTSYIPTEGSAVTRAADVASISGSNFSSWYRQDEGTFFGSSFAPQGNILFGTADTFDNTLYVTANPTFNVSIRSGGQTSATLTAPVSRSAASNVAVTYRVDDFAAVSDGGAVQADNLGPVPVNQLRLKIGSSPWSTGAGNDLNGHLRRLTYFPERLPDATLQAITTP